MQVAVSDDGRLHTVGRERIDCPGQVFTAHPKVDPSSGKGSPSALIDLQYRTLTYFR